jgi:hypothetical protein
VSYNSCNFASVVEIKLSTLGEEEEEVYICSSRLGLIKMDHRYSGNGETVSNERRNRN